MFRVASGQRPSHHASIKKRNSWETNICILIVHTCVSVLVVPLSYIYTYILYARRPAAFAFFCKVVGDDKPRLGELSDWRCDSQLGPEKISDRGWTYDKNRRSHRARVPIFIVCETNLSCHFALRATMSEGKKL